MGREIQRMNQMDRNQFRQFGLTLLGLVILILAVEAVAVPPDPYSQIYFVTPLIVISIVLSYWLVYRNGYQRIQQTR